MPVHHYPDILLHPLVDQPPIINTEAIKPVLERVWRSDDGLCHALWGYYSKNSIPIAVPLSRNRFNPKPINRGQPTVFLPGRQVAVFETVWMGGNLVWSLAGPDGRNRTGTAGCPRG